MFPVSAPCGVSAVSGVLAFGNNRRYLVSHMYVVACREVEAGYLQRRQQQRQTMLLASAAGRAPLAPSSTHLRWFDVFTQSYFSPSITQASNTDAQSICKAQLSLGCCDVLQCLLHQPLSAVSSQSTIPCLLTLHLCLV